ncbi:hypothetical protein FOA52_011923 [Chlamydomonas sp. UWO 241]|nr:hypothetical protein FOA52_011923 [Chlamydomonas sp. UWO 241]
MFEFINRRKKAIFYTVAGAAAAGTAYYSWQYWTESSNSDGEGGRGRRGSRRQHPSLLDLARASEGLGPLEDGRHYSRVTGSPTAPAAAPSAERAFSIEELAATAEEELSAAGGEQSMDASMDSHFTYIQDVSAPQELDSLLPQLHATLVQLTDIKLLKAQQALKAQSGSPVDAETQLRGLARLCFVRAIGACWLIPAMDLLVRVKLNLIGRHLFLQEKLGKLRASGSLSQLGGGPLPAPMSAEAIEAFLDCSWFARTGCRWMIERVTDGVDATLSGVALEADVAPGDVFKIMASMLREVEAAMLRCPLRLGQGPARSGGAPAASSSGSAGIGGGEGTHPQQQQQQWRSTGNPWHDMLAGPSSAASINTQDAWASGGADAYSAAASTAASVHELHTQLCDILSGARFNDAMRNSVQHTFRASAVHIYQGFPSAADGGAASGSAAGGSGAAAAAAVVSPRPQPASSPRPGEPSAGGASGSGGLAGLLTGRTSLSGRKAVFGTVPSLACLHSAGHSDAQPHHSSGHGGNNSGGSGGSSPHQLPRESKPARPLARALRSVQAGGDAAFASIKEVTKGISALPAVMALAATAFASSGNS